MKALMPESIAFIEGALRHMRKQLGGTFDSFISVSVRSIFNFQILQGKNCYEHVIT